MSVRYRATIKIVIPQLVHCQNCNCRFIYEQTVAGCGGSNSILYATEVEAQAAAEKDARDNLNYHLNNRAELYTPIPCPQCHRYQPYMRKRTGHDQYLSMEFMAGSLIVLGFLAGVWGAVAWYSDQQPKFTARVVGFIGLGALLVGGILWTWMHRLIARYDANSTPEATRIKLATERAMSLEAYEQKQLVEVRKKYKEDLAARSSELRDLKPWEKQPEPLIIQWWVEPSVFLYGGTITFQLSETNTATVVVPEDASPDSEFELTQTGEEAMPTKLRVHAINTHPEEQRVE